MQGEGAEESNAVDVAVEEFTAEGEEGAVEDEEEERPVEIAVVHDMGGGLCERIKDCEGLLRDGD